MSAYAKNLPATLEPPRDPCQQLRIVAQYLHPNSRANRYCALFRIVLVELVHLIDDVLYLMPERINGKWHTRLMLADSDSEVAIGGFALAVGIVELMNDYANVQAAYFHTMR